MGKLGKIRYVVLYSGPHDHEEELDGVSDEAAAIREAERRHRGPGFSVFGLEKRITLWEAPVSDDPMV